jgi:hypothetical protein
MPQGHAQQRFVSGVSDSAAAKAVAALKQQQAATAAAGTATAASASSSAAPPPPARLSCQAGQLPELIIRGQVGALVSWQPGALSNPPAPPLPVVVVCS